MSLVRSPFDDLFTFPLMSSMPVIRNLEHDSNSMLRRSSPSYEISEDDKQFQLSMDVPGVKPDDMKVQVEQGGRVLHLSGGRKLKKGNSVTESRFEKRFTLDRSIDASKITANLADGVMVVSAPKVSDHKRVTQIQITQNPHPQLKESKENKEYDPEQLM